MIIDFITLVKIGGLVGGIQYIFRFPSLQKISAILPVPFWIYFFSILLSTFHFLPQQSPVYTYFSSIVLSGALFLMLITTPMRDLLNMGKQATQAMVLASSTMFVGGLISFLIMKRWLPVDGAHSIGVLLGTWVGGSANMITVKEIFHVSDGSLGTLVIIDTFLSYGWMALLLIGIRFQRFFASASDIPLQKSNLQRSELSTFVRDLWISLITLLLGLVVGFFMFRVGTWISIYISFLGTTAWTLLIASIVATVLSTTPLQRWGDYKSSQVGSFLLYCVLVTIGAKSSLQWIGTILPFLFTGFLILFIHGFLLIFIGRYIKIPLNLLATASQANVGGVISAPIVAEAYKTGTASVGVLMGVFGTLVGTYVGVLGGGICYWMSQLK